VALTPGDTLFLGQLGEAYALTGSIEKARQLLGYAPRYSSLEAVQESVAWMARQGLIAGLT